MSTLGPAPPAATACNVLRVQLVIAAAEHPAPPAPSVQLPTVAMPLPSVVVVSTVALPPPPVTLNVTDTFGSGLLFTSLTNTLGFVATTAPTAAVCASPALMVMVLG